MATESLFSIERRRGFRWGAIWAGSFVALATWVVLNFLGLAIGLSSVEPMRAGALETFGVGAVIWMVAVEIVALFCGAFVAARAAGVWSRASGLMHGVVVWGFTTIVAVALGSFMVGSIASAGLDVFGRTAGRTETGRGVAEATGSILGFDRDSVFGAVNARLREQGKPPLTDAQMTATMRDVALTPGTMLDREAFASALSRNTALSMEEARDLAARTNVGQGRQRLAQRAEVASTMAGRAFWAMFIAAILALLAALAGGAIGAAPRRVTALPVAPEPERAPPIGAREVYP